MNKTTVAIISKPPVFLNLRASVHLALEEINNAASQGAALIAFPETWLPGYPVWLDFAPKSGMWGQQGAEQLFSILQDNALTLHDQYCQQFEKLANKLNVVVVMGAHEKVGNTLYNSMFYFRPNAKTLVHRKLMPTYTEKLIWGVGDGSTLTVFDSKIGRIGGLICWEHWMPLARAAMHDQAEQIHISQWPKVRDIHQVASRHYAFEGRCFVLASGTLLTKGDVIEGFNSLKLDCTEAKKLLESMEGNYDSLIHNSGSAVIGPDGEYIVQPQYEKDAIIITDIDLDKIKTASLTLDTNGHYSRPDIFNLKVDIRAKNNVEYITE